jgi:hypothetical protein
MRRHCYISRKNQALYLLLGRICDDTLLFHVEITSSWRSAQLIKPRNNFTFYFCLYQLFLPLSYFQQEIDSCHDLYNFSTKSNYTLAKGAVRTYNIVFWQGGIVFYIQFICDFAAFQASVLKYVCTHRVGNVEQTGPEADWGSCG